MHTRANRPETVTVELRGHVLDRMSFETSEQAEGYKRSVRQWAREKGIIVGIWTQRVQHALPAISIRSQAV